jgi:hypothetical protein
MDNKQTPAPGKPDRKESIAFCAVTTPLETAEVLRVSECCRFVKYTKGPVTVWCRVFPEIGGGMYITPLGDRVDIVLCYLRPVNTPYVDILSSQL